MKNPKSGVPCGLSFSTYVGHMLSELVRDIITGTLVSPHLSGLSASYNLAWYAASPSPLDLFGFQRLILSVSRASVFWVLCCTMWYPGSSFPPRTCFPTKKDLGQPYIWRTLWVIFPWDASKLGEKHSLTACLLATDASRWCETLDMRKLWEIKDRSFLVCCVSYY